MFVNVLFDKSIIKEKRLFDNEEYEQTFVIKGWKSLKKSGGEAKRKSDDRCGGILSESHNILIYVLQLTTRYSRIGHADKENH